MGNSNKSSLRKSQSVPDTQRLALDAPVFDKQKSVSQVRLNQPHEKSGKPGKSGKKHKLLNEEIPQLASSDSAFLPEFPLRRELEDLDFHILGVIASGAYGNVIKVLREDEKKFYAVKELDKAQIIEEGAIRQCKDEATIQSMAGEHPFVVKAHEYWQSSRNLYIVLDYVPYGDMFTLWTFHGAFPEKLVQVYIAEMATVIDFLHNSSVIYRDVKMENILFNAKGHIQLTDFGLAKWLRGGDQTRTVCGTLQYMAPEVLSVYPYDHSADWWSLGILMFAMLAGRYPVDGADTHSRMAQRVFECDFLLPGQISDLAQDVINNLLTKSPHKRLCDVNSLQDMEFFQDIFFNDLMEQKLNPVDVVPEDFFPMTGQSWAPQLLTAEEQSNFDKFDGNNDNFADDHSDKHLADYYRHQPQALKHHPDPVPRYQVSDGQSQHLYAGQRSSPGEQLDHLQRLGEKGHTHQNPGAREYSQQHPGEREYGQQHPGEREHSQQHPGEREHSQQHPGEREHSQHHPQQHLKDQRVPFAEFLNSAASLGSRQVNMKASSTAISGDGRPDYPSSLSTVKHAHSRHRQNDVHHARQNHLDGLLPQTSTDTSEKIQSDKLNFSSEQIARSNSNSHRRSCEPDSSSNYEVRSANNSPGFASSSTALSKVNSSAESTNRTSAEFKMVEVLPTVTLKTLAPVSSGAAAPVSSIQLMNSQNDLSYGSEVSLRSSVPTGSALQSYKRKDSYGMSVPSQRLERPVQGHNSGINSKPGGAQVPGDSRVLNQEYKTFEVAPTISLPSPEIRFTQNPNVPQKNNLQHRMSQGNNLHLSVPQGNNLQPGMSQSNNLQPGMSQSNNLQPGMSQSNNLQPGMSQSNNLQPSVPQRSNLQPGMFQSNNLQPSLSQNNNLQPSLSQSNNLQSSLSQSNNLQSSMSQNNNLQPIIPFSNSFQQPPQIKGNHFSSGTQINSSSTDRDYERLQQTMVTLNSTSHPSAATQQSAVTVKPVPAQRPAVPTKPSVPVKPIPAPRRSLRRKSHSHILDGQEGAESHQDQMISDSSVSYPSTSAVSRGWQVLPQPQNRTVLNNSSVTPQNWRTVPQNRPGMNNQSTNPQDWRNTPQPQNQSDVNNPSLNPQGWRNTPQPQIRSSENNSSHIAHECRNVSQAADESRPRSGSAGSSRPESIARSSSVDSQNFEWNLPVGTRPSFV